MKSYGGSLRYELEYVGDGDEISSPDVILKGNRQELVYYGNQPLLSNERQSLSVSFLPQYWSKSNGERATRQEIMMALANIDHLLIKLQYVRKVQRTVELLHITMDSSGSRDLGLGSASLVEQCRCPAGYIGLSCESCAPGYERQDTGSWLGRCIPIREDCSSGYYRNINGECTECPCPLASSGNTCYLGPNNNVVCNCKRGFAGTRCEYCAEGYFGDPRYGSCEPEPADNRCDKRGTQSHDNGVCHCNPGYTGIYCNECERGSFLTPNVNECIQCFCSGLAVECKSSSWFRDNIHISFKNSRSEKLKVITDHEYPRPVDTNLVNIVNNELLLSTNEISSRPDEVYYWSLPTRFLGDKVTSYGGHLNYTVRYTPPPVGNMSPNNLPDVVIVSVSIIVFQLLLKGYIFISILFYLLVERYLYLLLS